MSKKIRRTIILALAVIVAVSAPLTALADTAVETADPAAPEVLEAPEKVMPISAPMGETSESGFETALIAVKTLIEVDDDVFTDFNYSSSYSNYETREGLIWYFNWSGEQNLKYSYISATASENGVLLNFYKYASDGKGFGLAVISKAEAVSISGEFIKRANPDTYGYYKPASDVYVNIGSREYTVVFNAEVNGYPFTAATLYCRVDKFTGEVTGYNTSNYDPRWYEFEDAAAIISEEEAVAAYVEKIGLGLEYVSIYNYESGETTILPVYRFSSFGDRFISAVTGDVVQYVYDRAVSGADTGAGGASSPAAMAENQMGASDSSGRASLSPAEIAASERVSSFITSEQALQNLLGTAGIEDLDIGGFPDQYISLYRDYVDRDRYCYNISLSSFGIPEARGTTLYGVYGRVEAETGRVLSFDLYYDSGFGGEVPEEEFTDDQVDAIVESFLKKEAPAEFAKSVLEFMYSPGVDPYSYRRGYYYQYVRYENDIPFRNNSITLSFDARSGRITSYNLNWNDSASFPDVGNVLEAVEALSVFAAQSGSSIFYTTAGDGKAALVYQFNYSAFIDPFTGMALDYNGMPPSEAGAPPDYKDIGGHWCEDVVMKLLDNGIVMWGGSFEPDMTLTQIEFLQFLMLTEPYYYYGYSPAMFFADRNIDIQIEDDKIITRQDAVWMITQYLGYARLAEQSEWFVYPFSDDVGDDYRGYVTICYMLGIVNGDGAGGFGAGDNITRAQAAMMIYNLILAK